MKRIVSLILLTGFFIACQAQEPKQDAFSQNQPKGRWQVHKKYDEQGNFN